MSSISLRATKRLSNEYKKIRESPPSNIQVAFKDLILEWHFLFTGLNDTPFAGGEYHGVLKFPEDYPFSPPSIRFITPNGRFKINTIVCFELSVFHPECWKPAYTVSAVLQGVYSFMMSETTDTVGSLVRDEKIIRELAEKSQKFNIKDGSTETFQDEIKVEPTEVSDADINPPIFKKMNDDVSKSTVSSKVAKITENAGTGGSLVLDKNFIVESTTTNREKPPEKLNDQSENVNPPPNTDEKPILRITLKPLHIIQTQKDDLNTQARRKEEKIQKSQTTMRIHRYESSALSEDKKLKGKWEKLTKAKH